MITCPHCKKRFAENKTKHFSVEERAKLLEIWKENFQDRRVRVSELLAEGPLRTFLWPYLQDCNTERSRQVTLAVLLQPLCTKEISVNGYSLAFSLYPGPKRYCLVLTAQWGHSPALDERIKSLEAKKLKELGLSE